MCIVLFLLPTVLKFFFELCSIQLAVNVQIPEAFGGLQGEAVFIDTEGSFIPQRAADIAQAVEDHCRRVASIQKTELEGSPASR